MHFRRLFAIAAVIFSCATFAKASPLNLVLTHTPDIFSSFGDISYSTGTQAFSATGFAMTLDLDGLAPPDHNITNGTFALNASISAAEVLSPGGTLTIGGSVPALGVGSPLLQASISSFGFQDLGGNEKLEFILSVTGGSLATPAYYGNVGSTFGIIMTTGGNFRGGTWGSFNTNFAGTVSSDASPLVPEPATMVLAGLGFVTLLRRNRRR